jgi:hypothetical protein
MKIYLWFTQDGSPSLKWSVTVFSAGAMLCLFTLSEILQSTEVAADIRTSFCLHSFELQLLEYSLEIVYKARPVTADHRLLPT